jgi:hypothetical protein
VTPQSPEETNRLTSIIKLLLETKGIDVNSADNRGHTALSLAALGGCEAAVRLLLETDGTDIHSLSERRSMPLCSAATRGHTKGVELLLSRGIAPDSQDAYGQTPMSTAAFYGYELILEMLMSRTEIKMDDKDSYGRTLLWCASVGGSESTVKLLLDKYRSNPDLADDFGRTPRYIASSRRHHAVVVKLFDQRFGGDDMGTLDSTNDMDSTRPITKWGAYKLPCVVCVVMFWTYSYHYHCKSCAAGCFDICVDCAESGASCMDITHKLTKRAWVNASWVLEAT